MKTNVPTHRNLLTPLLLGLSVLALAGCAGQGEFTQDGGSSRSNSPAESGDMRLGDTALSSGSLQMAGSLYEKTLQSNPQSFEATMGLGNVAYRSGDMERARLIYLQAEKLAPQRIEPKIGLARVQIHKRNLDAAIPIYRSVLALQPDEPTAVAGLGTALDLQGHHSEAQALYRQALLVHPDAQNLRINLGLSLVLSQKPREGANVLIEVANLPDAPAEARDNLALAFGVIGNTEAAKRLLSRDLPPASVENNLRFYAAMRKAYSENPLPSETFNPAAPAGVSAQVAAPISNPGAAVALAPGESEIASPNAALINSGETPLPAGRQVPLTQMFGTSGAGAK